MTCGFCKKSRVVIGKVSPRLANRLAILENAQLARKRMDTTSPPQLGSSEPPGASSGQPEALRQVGAGNNGE